MSNLCTSFRWVFEKSCDSNNDENLKLVKRCEDKNLINVQHVSQKKQKKYFVFRLESTQSRHYYYQAIPYKFN